jgi:hypothetical protein
MANDFHDPARNGLFDPIDKKRAPIRTWYDAEDLTAQLIHLDPDVVCVGNGNGVEQKAAIDALGRERFLFSEYGWLPWNQHFYISRNGCGNASEIAHMNAADLARIPIDAEALTRLKSLFSSGNSVNERDFIYVPLQKDVNDFKFLSAPFTTNEEFLNFIHEIVPREMTILVKPHPLYPKKYDLAKYGRMRNIADDGLCKSDLYARMAAMICINSTSILEALLFEGRVFAYGEDIFLNKDLVHYRVNSPKDFAALLGQPVPESNCRRFISLLLERQIDRARCLRNDRAYIDSHYWNRCL